MRISVAEQKAWEAKSWRLWRPGEADQKEGGVWSKSWFLLGKMPSLIVTFFSVAPSSLSCLSYHVDMLPYSSVDLGL
jgi:hypothetical protein